jgi:hypothetical protein
LGFSSTEIDLALTAPLGAEDEIAPEPPRETQVQLGDIWEAGPHRIGCGDARDAAFLSRLMAGAVADVAFLDPPYNLSIRQQATTRGAHREFVMAAGEMSAAEYAAFLQDSLMAAVACSRPGAVHFVCSDWRHLQEMLSAVAPAYGEVLNLCVWAKSNAGMGSLYRSQHELVLVCRVGAERHFNAIQLSRNGRHRTNLWTYPSVTSPRGSRRSDLELHPTTKPAGMVADALQDVSRRGDVVLDTFLGSGTTLVAAERTGRICRAADLDPIYVQTALDRWSGVTGLEPRVVSRLRRRRPA